MSYTLFERYLYLYLTLVSWKTAYFLVEKPIFENCQCSSTPTSPQLNNIVCQFVSWSTTYKGTDVCIFQGTPINSNIIPHNRPNRGYPVLTCRQSIHHRLVLKRDTGYQTHEFSAETGFLGKPQSLSLVNNCWSDSRLEPVVLKGRFLPSIQDTVDLSRQRFSHCRGGIKWVTINDSTSPERPSLG